MKVFKFGGGVLQDAASIRKLAEIVQAERPEIIVVSAMGKTTRALEAIFQQRVAGQPYEESVDVLIGFYRGVIAELFPDDERMERDFLPLQRQALMDELLSARALALPEKLYSTVVAWGESVSGQLICHYLQRLQDDLRFRWMDATDFIHTGPRDRFCNAQIDWTATKRMVKKTFNHLLDQKIGLLMQGFVGTRSGATTTLGKEGSDYTAAVIANLLGATSVTVWKDVPGVMWADPRLLNDAAVMEQLSYRDLAEIAFYGAKVIHPKTIAPLAAKRIPLYIRSFDDLQAVGTTVQAQAPAVQHPVYVVQEGGYLVQLCLGDCEFFGEEHVKAACHLLATEGIQVSLLDRGAFVLQLYLKRNVCKLTRVLAAFREKFEVRCQTPVSLLTVVRPAGPVPPALLAGKLILMAKEGPGIYQAVLQDE